MPQTTEKILDVKGLSISFRGENGWLRAVDGVDFSVSQGECVGLVGESGSGKSITSLSLMGLLDKDHAKVEASKSDFLGNSLLDMNEKQLRKIRGDRMSMIFQEPMTSLNPVYTVGNQISEVLKLHKGMSNSEALAKSEKLIELVKIPSAKHCLKRYPHELSGGMRQRVMIAMALACEPELLIADEPTTALDVTIQAQILSLMNDLRKKLGKAIIMITHDLGVVANVCQRVLVMYGGRIVESGPTKEIFENPKHPYTKGLLGSIPKLGGASKRLKTIPGSVPSIAEFPKGCRFADRCVSAQTRCFDEVPTVSRYGDLHEASCFLLND